MSSTNSATVFSREFGATASGQRVVLYTLRGRSGMVAQISSYGATLTSLQVPLHRSARGELAREQSGAAPEVADVVLGFDSLAPYLAGHPHLGVTTGRVANRIAHATFALDGALYRLSRNDGEHHLHGGVRGIDKHVWRGELGRSTTGPGQDARSHGDASRTGDDTEAPSVTLHLRSEAGDQGYSGNLDIAVSYTVTADNAVRIDYRARTDAATPVNLTNHSYFHLGAPGQGGRPNGHREGHSDGQAQRASDVDMDILDHELQIFAETVTPVDEHFIPTGVYASVAGTPFDFREPRRIGDAMKARADQGFDINYALSLEKRSDAALAATLREPMSGRRMRVYTTEPGLQLYTGNFLDGSIVGKYGQRYRQYAGLCLEAQHFPNAVNVAGFPQTILRPGEVYRQTTIYAFDYDGGEAA